MKKQIVRVFALLFFLSFSTIVFSKVNKYEERCRTGIAGLECKKVITETNYRNDGSGDWLKPSEAFKFRTTNEKSCKVIVDWENSYFNNCKVVYSSCYVNRRGDWTSNGILIEALNENSWNYSLSYNVQWNN